MEGASEFCSLSPGAERNKYADDEYLETFRFEGAYRDRCRRALRFPFVVRTIRRKENGTLTDLVEDIEIQTRDAEIPPEKQKFKIEVDQAAIVIRSVLLDRIEGRRSKIATYLANLLSKIGIKIDPFSRDQDSARQKLSQYLVSLGGAAEVGLMNLHPSQPAFAALALRSLKDEFVSREAGRVKNDYVFRLGFYGLLITVLCSTLYAASFYLDSDHLIYRFRNFFILGIGSAVGTWLSFSLRRVVLEFSDLALLEEDRLDPGLRMLFMLCLTTIVGMLFWTEAVTIEFGGLLGEFGSSGSRAFLIGALCGIAERAVTTAVSRRAADFVSGLGERPGK